MDRKGIQFYIDTFLKISTKERKNRYEAHAIAHPYLYDLASEGVGTIFEIFKIAMLQPDFFKRQEKSYSFQINLISHPEHEFYCSFFVPLANKETTHTYSPMHTHGEYMLSSINAFGEGYNSLIWKKGWEMDVTTKEVDMKLLKYCKHKHLNIEFMDANTAHTIFYPEKICVTYAFWTHSRPTNLINKLRSKKFVKKNKELLKKIVKVLIPSPSLVGLVVHKEDYFYPKNGKLYLGSDREVQPVVNTFCQNFFSILQELGFNDKVFIESLKTKLPEEDLLLVRSWIEKFITGTPIAINYEGYNTHHDRRNIHIDEYKKIYNFDLH
jgi:hypothetical protein